eukprot:IDg3448t1
MPHYGLCDSGDLWHRTIDRHHRLNLGMTPLRSDQALYALMHKVTLVGLSGGYVDDLLRAGPTSFRKYANKTREKFDIGQDETLPCSFSGFILPKYNERLMEQNQKQYLKKLGALPLDSSFSDFRSMRMRLAWIGNARPDCLLEISQLSQVTEKRFSIENIPTLRLLKKAIRF